LDFSFSRKEFRFRAKLLRGQAFELVVLAIEITGNLLDSV